MSDRPKKNRSARDKKLARERARREARRQQNACRIYALQPPFEGYKEWIRVPEAAKDAFEHPARYDDRLTDTAKDLADTIVKLGPRYGGMVPMAAVYLDQQISKGTIYVAATGEPDNCRPIPLQELAADLSNPETARQMREQHPEADLPEEVTLITDDAAAMSLHELHAHGFLVLDDDNIVNLAVPPQIPGGEWILNGRDPEW